MTDRVNFVAAMIVQMVAQIQKPVITILMQFQMTVVVWSMTNAAYVEEKELQKANVTVMGTLKTSVEFVAVQELQKAIVIVKATFLTSVEFVEAQGLQMENVTALETFLMSVEFAAETEFLKALATVQVTC
jgi:hypothetical protein